MKYPQAFFLYTASLKILDVVSVLIAWQLAWALRFDYGMLPLSKGIPDYTLYFDMMGWAGFIFFLVFHIIGLYKKERIEFGFRSVKKVFEGTLLSTLVFISVLYLKEAVNYSRIYLVVFFITAVVTLTLQRWLSSLTWRYLVHHFVVPLKVLCIGKGEFLEDYVRRLRQEDPYRIEWLGRVGEPGALASLNHLGPYENWKKIVEHFRPDMGVLSLPAHQSSSYSAILEGLLNTSVEIKLVPDFGRYSSFSYEATQECNIPLLVFNRAPLGSSDRFLKRLLDVGGATLFLILFSPLYLALMLLIKATSKGPIFYRQERVGADGQLFTMLKFRSMCQDAEVQTGAVWAQKNDPRVTPIGKWMRRTSLDEIPQFLNVLKGEMSLVGPRPERPYFVEQFQQEIPKYMQRHKMKSGITGWAQVNGWRGNTSIQERIKYDLYYIEHWSLWFDLKILILTVFRGFVHRNAY